MMCNSFVFLGFMTKCLIWWLSKKKSILSENINCREKSTEITLGTILHSYEIFCLFEHYVISGDKYICIKWGNLNVAKKLVSWVKFNFCLNPCVKYAWNTILHCWVFKLPFLINKLYLLYFRFFSSWMYIIFFIYVLWGYHFW